MSCRTIVGSLLLMGILAAHQANAADCSQSYEFRLRRSLADKNQTAKAAAIAVTQPDEGKSSYSVDAGMGAALTRNCGSNTLWEFGLGAELHRNNLVDEEQDTLEIVPSVGATIGDITTSGTAWFPQATMTFKRDRAKGTESIVPSLQATVAGTPLRIGKVLGPEDLGFLWQPSLGAEYEDIRKTEGDDPTGHVGRMFGRVEFFVYPGFKSLSARLELMAAWQTWSDFSESPALDDGDDRHQMRELSLTYYLDDDQHFGISVDSIDGDNPSEGLLDQHYERLTFKAKF